MKLADAIATWWIKNAEIRHGHVPQIGNVVAPEPPAAASQSPPSSSPSMLSKAAPVIAATVLGAGGMAAIPAVIDWATPDPPAVVQPATETERDGSLYQYLEDRGDHLPL